MKPASDTDEGELGGIDTFDSIPDNYTFVKAGCWKTACPVWAADGG
jgi:hypothetical protein